MFRSHEDCKRWKESFMKGGKREVLGREKDSYPFGISMSTWPKSALPNSHLSSSIKSHGQTRNACSSSKEMILQALPHARGHPHCCRQASALCLPHVPLLLHAGHTMTNPPRDPLRRLPSRPFHLRGLPGSLLENMEGDHKSVPTWREGKCVRGPASISPPNPQLQAPASCPPQLLCAVIPSAYNTVPVPWTPT